jgi:hypothetical protein
MHDQIAVSGRLDQNARSRQGHALVDVAIHRKQTEPVVALTAKQIETRLRLLRPVNRDTDLGGRTPNIRILLSTFAGSEGKTQE